jgi:hypothetical protein
MAPMVSALQLRPSGAYSRKAPNSEHFVVKSFLSLTQHHHPAQALLAGAGTNRNATSSEKQQPARQQSDISLLEAVRPKRRQIRFGYLIPSCRGLVANVGDDQRTLSQCCNSLIRFSGILLVIASFHCDRADRW